jgi:hypothetical protein
VLRVKVAAGFYHSVCVVRPPGEPDAIAEPTGGTLSLDLRKMLNNSSCSDVTFMVEDRALYAHRCILMARCEPLEKMLGGRMREGSQSEIAIPEYSVRDLLMVRSVCCLSAWLILLLVSLFTPQYDVFAALLEFLYTDEVRVLDASDVNAGERRQ